MIVVMRRSFYSIQFLLNDNGEAVSYLVHGYMSSPEVTVFNSRRGAVVECLTGNFFAGFDSASVFLFLPSSFLPPTKSTAVFVVMRVICTHFLVSSTIRN